jgi:hypothetical protein
MKCFNDEPLSRGLRRALQQRAFEQRHRLHHAKGHARRASAGDSGRAGSEVGRGEETAEESPPAGGVTDETDYFRLADTTGQSLPTLEDSDFAWFDNACSLCHFPGPCTSPKRLDVNCDVVFFCAVLRG